MSGPERHQHIAQVLSDRIASGDLRPGDHLPPEPELARHLGVSRFTLRKALDSLAHEGRVVRQRGLGTRVADHSAKGSGALISYLGETDTHIYADLFVELTRASQAAGMRIQVLEPEQVQNYQPLVRRDGRDFVNHLVCAGTATRLLAEVPGSEAPHTHQALRVVAGLRLNSADGFDYAVMADHQEALMQSVRHLTRLGHRRIALVSSPFDEHVPSIPGLYRMALVSSGQTWERILTSSGPDTSWTEQLIEQLRDGEKPTALVCEMDFMAVYVFDAVKALGWSIPETLSVIGMYDTPWSKVLRPQLATVGFPIDLIAKLTVACLMAGRPTSPQQIGVRGTLIERLSTLTPNSTPTSTPPAL